MKVFVTGADGMLGTNIVLTLLEKNYEVIALVHPSSKSTTLKNLKIETIVGDVLKPETFIEALSKCDYIIHVAASTSLWPGRNELVNKINIDGTKNLVRAAKEANIRRFIHCGSASSFAPGTLENPGTEKSPYNGWRFKNDYMDSKYKCQVMLEKEFNENGFPMIIVTPTYMIGPYDSGPTSGRLVLSVVEGQVPGYSIGAKSFVHTRDVAMAMVNALTMGRLGESYIAAGTNLTYGQFFKKVCEVAGIKFNIPRLPYFLVVTVGFVLSVIARITGKPPKLSYGMTRMSGMYQYYTPKKAVAELQMPQTPIDQAIKECLDWFKENNVTLS